MLSGAAKHDTHTDRKANFAVYCWCHPGKGEPTTTQANPSWRFSQWPGQHWLLPVEAPQGAARVATSATGQERRVMEQCCALPHCVCPPVLSSARFPATFCCRTGHSCYLSIAVFPLQQPHVLHRALVEGETLGSYFINHVPHAQLTRICLSSSSG